MLCTPNCQKPCTFNYRLQPFSFDNNEIVTSGEKLPDWAELSSGRVAGIIKMIFFMWLCRLITWILHQVSFWSGGAREKVFDKGIYSVN